MKQFQKILNDQNICFFSSVSKETALQALVDQLVQTKTLQNKEPFYSALLHREDLMSTAIGLGAAIPHAKLPTFTQFFLAIGIAKEGIDWHAEDEVPVKCIFLIGGPDNQPDEYLSLLSNLTRSIRSDEVLAKLISAKDEKEVYSILHTVFM